MIDMIEKVLLVFKIHLDIGFTGYASDVPETYIHEYLPAAINRFIRGICISICTTMYGIQTFPCGIRMTQNSDLPFITDQTHIKMIRHMHECRNK